MKSIVCLQGSPRKDGNSAFLVDQFCLSAEKYNTKIKRHQLSELKYQGCQNLFACKTTLDRCGQQDDLTSVLDDIVDADIVLLSSPIFFTDVTGQLKSCLDRWFSFFVADYPTAEVKSRLKPGKVLVFVQTQGEDESRYRDILDKYNHSLEWLGFSTSYLIRATGVREAGDIHGHPEVIEQTRTLAQNLCS